MFYRLLREPIIGFCRTDSVVPIPLLAAQEAVDLPCEALQRSIGLSLAGGQVLKGLDQVNIAVGYLLQRRFDPVHTVLVDCEALLGAALEAVYQPRLDKQAVRDLIQLGFEFVHSLLRRDAPGRALRTRFTAFTSVYDVSPSHKRITFAGLVK